MEQTVMSERLDLYDASVLVFEEAQSFHELTSTTEEIRAHRERLHELAEKLRHEAMRLEPAPLDLEVLDDVYYARLLGIDVDAHRCDCEVCSRSSVWCPASLSSLRLEIADRCRACVTKRSA